MLWEDGERLFCRRWHMPFFATALLPVAGTWPVSLLVVITSLISSLALVLTPKIGYAPPETLTP